MRPSASCSQWCTRLWLTIALIVPVSAAAQDTRAEAHAQAQAAKAATVTPPTVSGFERTVRRLKSLGLFDASPTAFYPQVTTIYPGGWVAFGGGYRRPLGDPAVFDIKTAWSLKNFKIVETTVALPALVNGTLNLEIAGRWIDAPSVVFYGVGNDTPPEAETTFAYRPTTVGVTLSTASWEAVTLGSGVDYVAIESRSLSAGLTGPAAVMQQQSGPARGPRYLRSRGFAQIDWRQTPGYSGKGGLYRFEVQDYSDRSGSHLSFRSAEAEAVQLVPILRANWVLAGRALATITDNGGRDEVPFYLMPALGGNSSVRGYPSLRFRGNHRLLISAEYRWTATGFLDMAIFYDAGKVATDLDQLNLRNLRSAYGIGARFHSKKKTVFRIETARNDQGGWRLVWSTHAAF